MLKTFLWSTKYRLSLTNIDLGNIQLSLNGSVTFSLLIFFFSIATILVALGHVTLKNDIAVGITCLINRYKIHTKRQIKIMARKGGNLKFFYA